MPAIALETVSIEEYVREVLPHTHPLWGAGRSIERHAADLHEVAASPYARRRRYLVGLRDASNALAATCKTYAREMRTRDRTLQVTAIGAVFTQPAQRGRSFATALLGALLDAERDAGRDVCLLFSDIGTAFYARLGFRALPARVLTLRAASLDDRPSGALPLEDRDWTGVRRCFEATERERPWALRRTPTIWRAMRGRWAAQPLDHGVGALRLVARRGATVIAYAFGRRVVAEDTFALDEFAYDGEAGRALVAPILRAAAGDLGRVGGWLPPPGAREVLPRGSVRVRNDAVPMAVALSIPASGWLAAVERDREPSADPFWAADHV